MADIGLGMPARRAAVLYRDEHPHDHAYRVEPCLRPAYGPPAGAAHADRPLRKAGPPLRCAAVALRQDVAPAPFPCGYEMRHPRWRRDPIAWRSPMGRSGLAAVRGSSGERLQAQWVNAWEACLRISYRRWNSGLKGGVCTRRTEGLRRHWRDRSTPDMAKNPVCKAGCSQPMVDPLQLKHRRLILVMKGHSPSWYKVLRTRERPGR